MLELLRVATGVRAGARGGGQDVALARAPVLAVVDGVGDGGAAAAKAALDALVAAVPAGGPPDLGAAFAAAHAAAAGAAGRATAALAIVDPTLTLHVGHVGGVRVLLHRRTGHPLPPPVAPRHAPPVRGADGAWLACLTRDHTAVCDLVERGHLAPEAARGHALRGRLTRVLGGPRPPTPDLARVHLYPSDVVLVASDGLLDALSPEALLGALGDADDAQRAADALLAAAQATDDDVAIAILCVAAGVEAGATPRREEPKRPSARREPDARAAPADPLAEYGRDLSRAAEAGELDPVIGRDEEILALARAVVARKKPNAVLVGPAGVGKTAIVEGFALALASGALAEALKGKRLVEVSISAMLAGTKYRGEFEERLRELVRTAEQDPDLLLFIDELHTVMGAGDSSGGAGDASQILKPALSRGAIRLIGATTTAEYQRHIATDPAFERRFTVVRVEEPSEEHAIAILRGLRERFEGHYGVTVDDDALVAAVRLSKRHVHDRHLPDKAIELIDQACAQLLVPGAASARGTEVRREHVVALLARRQGVDEELLSEDLPTARERMAELDAFLASHVIGQDAATKLVARALRRAYGGLKDPRRPVASFLFLGPTGVGKTETAKVLCEFLFGDRERLLRIDMSEYGERHSVSRLVGSPPGYIGHDEEGQLTGPMHLLPQRVVLLDEIEKAHPEVLLVLLQLLDEGTLTDSRGKKASYREAVIVLTSNLIREQPGARRAIGFRAEAEAAPPRDDDALRDELTKTLPPELVGRIAEVVMFERLDAAAARGIAELTVRRILARLRQQGVTLEVPPDLIDRALADLGSLELGARMLERLLSERIGELLEAPRSSVPAPEPAIARRELTLVAAAPVSGSLDALAARARTGSWSPELTGMHAEGGRLLAALASARAGLELARALASDAWCVVHRGRVRGLGDAAPEGAAVAAAELVLEVLREAAGPRLVVTGSAARALGPEIPLRPVQLATEDDGVATSLELFAPEAP